MATKAIFNMIDHSREASKTQVYLPAIAGDGSNYAAVLGTGGNFDLVKAGIAAATLCNFSNNSAIPFEDINIPTTPSDPDAQREIKLWVQYADTVTGDYGELNIPGPIDTFKQVNTDEVDISANVAALALIAVLEANLVSRAGNAIQVTRMRYVRGAR